MPPPNSHSPAPACRAVLALVIIAQLLGCARNVHIAEAPPPVDIEPVTSLAGYGMELRLWALDATSWKRARNNAELEQLYQTWLALETERAAEQQNPQAADATFMQPADQPQPAGPPVDHADDGPKTFEQFVAARRVATPERPGLDVLARFGDTRGSLDGRVQEIWESNGVQFALVPIGELAGLGASMGVPGPLERTWWGATIPWSHMAKGAASGNRRLETDMGPLVLGPGRLALVGRAWPAPGVGQPVLRIELCPQFLPLRHSTSMRESRLTARLDDSNAPLGPLDEGPLFERLLLRGSLPKGYALVIAPARASPGAGTLGPSIPTSNLGEALLSAVGSDGSLRPVALVVVPVLPEWFSLDGG